MAFLQKMMRWLAGRVVPVPPRREGFYYSCLTCHDTRLITRLSDFGRMPCPVCGNDEGGGPESGDASPGYRGDDR